VKRRRKNSIGTIVPSLQVILTNRMPTITALRAIRLTKTASSLATTNPGKYNLLPETTTPCLSKTTGARDL
jgi:hypothetical protein